MRCTIEWRVIVAGAGLISAGMLLVDGFAASVALFYMAAALVGLGLSVLLGAALRYIMLNEAPPAERASAQSILTLSSSIGQVIGGLIGHDGHLDAPLGRTHRQPSDGKLCAGRWPLSIPDSPSAWETWVQKGPRDKTSSAHMPIAR